MAAPEGERDAAAGESAPREPGNPEPGNEVALPGAWQRSRVRVDARLLEATLLNLRKRIAAIPLVFDIPSADEVSAERSKLLSQIDDYLLPRVRQSAAPVLVALVGSTGAGKSTLVNSIVGTQVSLTGVRRPTTNSPVLACHPDDIGWFAENMFLPTLPRVHPDPRPLPGAGQGDLIARLRIARLRIARLRIARLRIARLRIAWLRIARLTRR